MNSEAPVALDIATRSGTGQPAISTYGAKKALPHWAVVPPTGDVMSSVRMVPIAAARASVAPDGLDSVTVNVSIGSTAVSPMTATLTVCETTPGAKVIVPEPAV